MVPERRGIHDDEVEVIRAALDCASVKTVDEAAKTAVGVLQVVARCECGCASVAFDALESEQSSTVIADGTGTTPRGGQVGVIVWGRRDAVTGLEVYDLGAGEGDLVLPVPESVIPWNRNNRPS